MPTAILGLYTADGFVIAADGLSVDDHGKAIRNNQKLFCVNDPSRKLAYGLTGAAVRINDPTDSFVALDLTKESQKIADALADKTTVDLLTYVKKFGFRLHKKINDAKNCGRISGYSPTFRPESVGSLPDYPSFVLGILQTRSSLCRFQNYSSQSIFRPVRLFEPPPHYRLPTIRFTYFQVTVSRKPRSTSDCFLHSGNEKTGHD